LNMTGKLGSKVVTCSKLFQNIEMIPALIHYVSQALAQGLYDMAIVTKNKKSIFHTPSQKQGEQRQMKQLKSISEISSLPPDTSFSDLPIQQR